MIQILSYLNNLPVFIHVVMGVAAFNIFLSGLHAALSSFKDKTASQVDDKIDAQVVSLQSVLQKALDIIGYNPEHK